MLHGTKCGLDRPGLIRTYARSSPTEEPRHRGRADRVLGDVALIYAGTTCIKADGQSGSRRYTDVWAKQVGRWCDSEAQGLVPFDLAGALWQDRPAR
jgi:hypothetical protein